MSVIFIANVGLRDIEINRTDLPEDARALGELILSDDKKNRGGWQRDITLPVISTALKSIIQKEDVSRVILFATKSKNPKTSHTDTVPLAKVVKWYLSSTEKQVKDKIDIIEIGQNANDYDVMMAFYKHRLQNLENAETKYDRVYLEVTGGTAAMAFVLLLQSVEVYGARVRPLFVPENGNVPYSLSIGHRLQFEAVLDDYRDMVEIHQYQAALNVLHTHEELCRRMFLYYDAIEAMTIYARQRFNFNFSDAEKTLFGVDERLHGTLRDHVIELANEITDRDSEWLLREEYFSFRIDLANGDYKNALSTAYAFIEAAMRTRLVKMGVVSDRNNMLDTDWLTRDPEMVRKIKYGAGNINDRKVLVRKDFENILRAFSQTDKSIKKLLALLEKVSKFVRLRNASIHNHAGVSRDLLETYEDGGVEGFCRDLETLYQEVTGQKIGANAFDAINRFILDLTMSQL